MPLTPAEQAELDQLELEDLEAEEAVYQASTQEQEIMRPVEAQARGAANVMSLGAGKYAAGAQGVITDPQDIYGKTMELGKAQEALKVEAQAAKDDLDTKLAEMEGLGFSKEERDQYKADLDRAIEQDISGRADAIANSYGTYMQNYQAGDTQAIEERPGAYLTGALMGGVLQGTGLARAGLAPGGRMAAEATMGGIEGFNAPSEGPMDTMSNMMIGMGLSGLPEVIGGAKNKLRGSLDKKSKEAALEMLDASPSDIRGLGTIDNEARIDKLGEKMRDEAMAWTQKGQNTKLNTLKDKLNVDLDNVYKEGDAASKGIPPNQLSGKLEAEADKIDFDSRGTQNKVSKKLRALARDIDEQALVDPSPIPVSKVREMRVNQDKLIKYGPLGSSAPNQEAGRKIRGSMREVENFLLGPLADDKFKATRADYGDVKDLLKVSDKAAAREGTGKGGLAGVLAKQTAGGAAGYALGEMSGDGGRGGYGAALGITGVQGLRKLTPTAKAMMYKKASNVFEEAYPTMRNMYGATPEAAQSYIQNK